MIKTFASACAVVALFSTLAPAFAGVKEGVDAWGKGDYANAIREWRAPAIAGDADAQFNLGQAYKLGRGVPVDLRLAQDWFQKASAQGHLQAEDNLGLIMFQNGDRQRAIPIIEKSANRGDARAQYIFGTALFNGDLITKDWPRAYGYMTRASQAGLSAASNSLAQMDRHIPLEQRQRGLVIARELESRGQRPQVAMNTPNRAPSIPAGSAIGSGRIDPVPVPPSYPQTYPQSQPYPQQNAPIYDPAPVAAPVQRNRRGRPVQPEVAQAPRPESAERGNTPSWRTGSVDALPRPGSRRRPAEAAPAPVEPEIFQDTYPEQPQSSYPAPQDYPSPAQPSYDPPVYDRAGTTYPEPGAAPRPRPAPRPAPIAKPRPAPAAPITKPAAVAKPAPVRTAGGAYRIQLGAFSDQGRAKSLWSSLSNNVSGLRGMQPYLVKAGSITRLQAGPLGSRAAAEKLCGQVKSSGQSCLVVSN